MRAKESKRERMRADTSKRERMRAKWNNLKRERKEAGWRERKRQMVPSINQHSSIKPTPNSKCHLPRRGIHVQNSLCIYAAEAYVCFV